MSDEERNRKIADRLISEMPKPRKTKVGKVQIWNAKINKPEPVKKK